AKKRADNGRGGVARGGRGVAARTLGMLVTILEHARKSLKLIKENPARGVSKPADNKRQRFLSVEEIAILGKALRDAEAKGDDSTPFTAIRFLLMTGLRRMEALGLKRRWIDARARCIRFEDTKSGPQLRPIGAEAAKLVAAQTESEWVFRGRGEE